MAAFSACVLAAGKGTRMGGDSPKVLFEVGQKPMIRWVLSALSAGGATDIVAVVGFGKDAVVTELPTGVRWVEQSPQLGTGHAVLCARSLFAGDDRPLVITCGDMPLIRSTTYQLIAELRESNNAACSMLTVSIDTESRFGRIIRNEAGKVVKIVEYKESTDEQRRIREGNAGVYCFRADALWDGLASVTNDNSQGEYYLTDVIAVLLEKGEVVIAHCCEDEQEAIGVNTPQDLALVEEQLKVRTG